MTPAAKVATGLELAAEGFADLRRERAELHHQLEANRAALVGGEQRALAMRYQALRARNVRHLLPGETSIPTAPPFDGLRAELPVSDPRTSRSLELYLPSRASKAAAGPLRRGFFARVLRWAP